MNDTNILANELLDYVENQRNKQIFVMRVMYGYTIKEICDKMNVSNKTVIKIVKNTTNMLKNKFC